MGIDLLTALSECRKHNIIHRDIKPSNIFVTEDNHYLLYGKLKKSKVNLKILGMCGLLSGILIGAAVMQGLFQKTDSPGVGISCGNVNSSGAVASDKNWIYSVVYGDYVYYIKASQDQNLLCRIPVQDGKVEILAEFVSNTYNFYPYQDKLYIYDQKEEQVPRYSFLSKFLIYAVFRLAEVSLK